MSVNYAVGVPLAFALGALLFGGLAFVATLDGYVDVAQLVSTTTPIAFILVLLVGCVAAVAAVAG